MNKAPKYPAAPYRAEPWFALFLNARKRLGNGKVAAALGVSGSATSQVANASGAYGAGQASTQRIAIKVQHVFGSYECPHLTAHHGTPHVITAEECRNYAHGQPPINSPGAMAHWRTCSTCEHKPLSAPPPPPKPPRKRRSGVKAVVPALFAKEPTA